ncbi:uncharacterized protein LOC131022751 [Salvia miltiorrhiza]|uniref:uncharacterized protein LOC131022751 n=1 Tax=Salvia miltiorrhiza TaxID=226208 RepID=UPI0025ACF6A4|nr:uncharacterized protein LOC131022751 [Salvia miltiorrhiza]
MDASGNRILSPSFTPLSSIPTQKITFGCPVIDCLFGGGLCLRTLTEVVGESGTGKTQIALQLALNVQLPIVHGGLDASALYIYTDFSFPIKRLKQLSLRIPNLPRNALDKGAI